MAFVGEGVVGEGDGAEFADAKVDQDLGTGLGVEELGEDEVGLERFVGFVEQDVDLGGFFWEIGEVHGADVPFGEQGIGEGDVAHVEA